MYFYQDTSEVKARVKRAMFGSTVRPESVQTWFGDMINLKYINLDGLDVSRIVNANHMFGRAGLKCSTMTIDMSKLGGWHSLTTAVGMFSSCGCRSINLSEFYAPKLSVAREMFFQCSCLDLKLAGWYAPNVENMESMFSSTNNLTYLDISYITTPSVTNFKNMFDTSVISGSPDALSTTSLIKIIDISNFDMASAEDVSRMFAGLPNLSAIYGPAELDINNYITDSSKLSGTFVGSTSLPGFSATKTSGTYLRHTPGDNFGYLTEKP